jgi:hypothetical protein
LNIGTNNNGGISSANITLAGGSTNPYLSIGQSSTIGSQGYGLNGIFLGRDSSTSKFSLVNADNDRWLKWTGTNLEIRGSITVEGGNAATDAAALSYAARAADSASISGSSALSAASNAQAAAFRAADSASLSGSAATAYALSQSTYRYNQSTNLLQTLADGGYSGSFIGSTTIYSPNIGGQNGYISNILKVGQNGITLDGGNKKIYVGGNGTTGLYNNANTPFYFASGSTDIFSLGNKLTWDGNTLGVTGTVVITAGSTKDEIDGKVTPAAVTNHIGGQNVTTIDGGKISALSFYGKSAKFDTGDVGGWIMDETGLYKKVGAYTLRLGANAQRISITQQAVNDSIDRVRIDASLNIPAITVSDTASLNWANSSQMIDVVYGTDSPPGVEVDTGFTLPEGCSNNQGSGCGIIGLVYAEEEIYVETENFPDITNTIFGNAGFPSAPDEVHTIYGFWRCTLKVRQYPTRLDAANQTNQNMTYGTKEVLVAYREIRKSNAYDPQDAPLDIDTQQVYGATISAQGGGGINTEGPGIWYRVELQQFWYLNVFGGNFESTIAGYRPASDIYVKYGRVQNGYSVFSPGGLQVYQGVRNYLNASVPEGTSGDASNFFIVKGKSQIIGSLSVSSGFSAAFKNFKIEHPLDKNRWLYHTSTEAPRADLIYRGQLQLQDGIGSASIDSASNMTIGTFNSLTKNPQLFLQNNESFDRIKGYVQSGSVYVLSENQNSNALIDWSVIAERNDTEMLKSPLYDTNGNYKTENFKSQYLDETRHERIPNFKEVI